MAITEKDRLKYGREITTAANEMSFWGQVKGGETTSIIQTDLQDDKVANGAAVRVFFADDVEGDGVQGNTDYSENRGTQVNLYQDVVYDNFGNSLKSLKLKLENKKATEAFGIKSRKGLIKWAALKEDKVISSMASANCTNIVACKDGGVREGNDTSSIIVGDIFSTASIKEAKKRAVNGIDGNGELHPPMLPYQTIVKNSMGIHVPVQYYIMTIGMYASDQLDSDPLWIEAQKMAASRKVADMDIISGYKGVFDSVIIVDRLSFNKKQSGILTSHAPDFGDYAGNFDIYKGAGGIETEINLLLGASAILMPMDEGFDYKEIRDEENEKLVCRISRGLGINKTKFIGKTKKEMDSVYHGKDFGVVAIINSIK